MKYTRRGSSQRTVAALAMLVLGLATMMFGFTSTASATPPDGKVVVCKYVSTPGGVLDHIVVVSANTIDGFGGTFPYSWTDAHGQSSQGSIAIRWAGEGPPPEQPSTIALSECPGGGASTPTTPASTPTTPASTPTTPVSTPTTPIETLPTEASTPTSGATDPTTPIETLPTEASVPNSPGGPNNPNNPGNQGGEEPEVLGIEANAPAAAPTAVDAGLTAQESGTSSTLWVLAGVALALAGLVLGFIPATPRGKRAI